MEENGVMSQQSIEEMASAFEDFNNCCEEFEQAFNSTMQGYMKDCEFAAAQKFLRYMHKYCDATFLTRWYWLRKARKCNDALKGIIQFNEEFFKNKKYDA